MFDDGEAEAAFGGVGAVDDGAGFGQVLQYGRARFDAAAGEYGEAAFDLAAILGAGDDFLAGVAAFFEVHAADGVLVEHLRDAAFFGGGANPRIAAADFVQFPGVFGGGVVRGQGGGFAGQEHAAVRQGDFDKAV